MECDHMGAIGAGLARQGRGSPGWVRTMRPLRRLGLKACIRIAIFACHGLLARALGDAVAMVDSHSVQVALILRESIQACPNYAKGATKAPQRSLIRCPVYTLGNGAGPCNPELPSPSSSRCPVYTLRTNSAGPSRNYKITITNNGVRKAVKVRYSVLRITITNNGVQMAVKICSPGTWVFLAALWERCITNNDNE
jgi:hypothetical protein